MAYSEAKATAVASYFLEQAGGELEDLKLMKLMYLADRQAILERNVSITGDRYCSLKNGPVLSHTLDRMTPRDQVDDENSVWRRHVEVPSKWRIALKTPVELPKVLSRSEIRIVSEVWEKYGSWSKWKLRDYSHTLTEYRDPGDSMIPIAFQDILAGLGLSEDDQRSRYAEYQALSGA